MERRTLLVFFVVGLGAMLAHLQAPDRDAWLFDILALSVALAVVLRVPVSTGGGAGIARARLLVVAAAALVPQAVGAVRLIRGEPAHAGVVAAATCTRSCWSCPLTMHGIADLLTARRALATAMLSSPRSPAAPTPDGDPCVCCVRTGRADDAAASFPCSWEDGTQVNTADGASMEETE